MADSVLLTVASINNQNLSTTVPTVFDVSKLGGIEANANAAATVTVTANTAYGTSLWALSFAKGMVIPTKLYFKVVDNGSTNDCIVYSDSGLTRVVCKSDTAVGDGSRATLVEKNESGISGAVTLAGSNSNNSYLTIANATANAGLDLAGASQFVYEGVKYTVSESVSAIQTAISGADSFLEAEVSLTADEIKALKDTPVEIISAPGDGYTIEVVSGIVILDATSTAFVTNTDIDLAFSTAATTKIGTAATALAGTSDKIVSIVKSAGAIVENDSVVITEVDGNPATGTGTAIVKVTYKITAL